jgi:uncharacterized membrane protein YagU involved in acid resistance
MESGMIVRVLRGGVSGIVATLLMTGVMYAGKWAGLLETPPPKEITAHAGRKAAVPPEDVPDSTFDVTWVAAHFGYGAACGALFGLLIPVLPRRAWFSGLLYGGVLWAIGYLKVLPQLGLYPHFSKDSSSRTAVMIAAHAVYGMTLAEASGQ